MTTCGAARRIQPQITSRQIQKSRLFQTDEVVRLEPDEIHVWTISLETENAAELRHFLSDEELARAKRFRFVREQTQFVAARGFLRLILGRYLNKNPGQIDFAYNPFGKPSLKSDMKSRLKFNLSHSRETAICAVTLEDEIGVDLEFINAESVDDEVAADVLTEAEYEFFKSLPEAVRAEIFYKCWTIKEAYVKARGEGLTIDPKEIETLFVQKTSIGKYQESSQIAGNTNWSFVSLPEIMGFAAALAVKGVAKKHLQFFTLSK